ncbi:hypothetical protein FOMPIDRAFT_1127431, partial [Fomitopsis schrenkii]
MQSREFSRGVIRLHLDLISDELLFLTDDDLIDRANRDVAPHFTLSAERHVNAKIHYNEWVNTQFSDRARYRTHMSLHQVAQILQYQGSEVLAEHAITTALDGIPGAYVRRQKLYSVDGKAFPETIQFAALHSSMPPTSSLSLEYFSRLPISPSNPALLLCARGPHAWDTRSYIPQAALEYSLSSTLRDLARTATPNLRSLMDALQCQQHARQHDTESLPSDQNGAAHNETALPEWALHIGLIYDSQEIRCVAHIPYSPPSDTYLSLHFATLPLPPNCSDTGDLKEFIEGRYRVAVALLSLQHHIARLAKLYQEASW